MSRFKRVFERPGRRLAYSVDLLDGRGNGILIPSRRTAAAETRPGVWMQRRCYMTGRSNRPLFTVDNLPILRRYLCLRKGPRA